MLVTGGASGLGAAIAHAAAATGYRVGVIDLDQPLDGDVGGRSASLVTSYVASVTDDDAIEQVFDDFGVPDVVVNNAGVVRFGPLVSQSIDDFRCVLEVNLAGRGDRAQKFFHLGIALVEKPRRWEVRK